MGRPKGSSNKPKNVTIKKEKQTTDYVIDKEEHKMICINCGASNQNNFYTSNDKYHGYFRKVPYCKDCMKEIFLKYLKKYKGNRNIAIYYTCRKADLAYIHANYIGAVNTIENPNSSIKELEDDDTRILSAYLKGLSFSERNGWGFGFDDSQGEREIDGLSSFDDITKIKRKKKITEEDIDEEKYEVIEYDTDDLQAKWGMFDTDDLAYLENEYLDWCDKLIGITDKSTDVLVQQICLQCNEIRKGRELGENVDKKLATLQTLLNNSGLIEKQNSATSAKKSAGQRIEDIEKLRPVKTVDHELTDVDNIKKLIIGFTGSTCRALGKTNKYTEMFDELYKDYTIDMIEDLAEENHIKEKQPDSDKPNENGD